MMDSFKKYGLFYLILFLIFFIVFIFYLNNNNSSSLLTFGMLDVGQGDSFFIESPNGTQILIDGGKDRKIIGKLSPLMLFYDRTIDIVIITNPDLDHIGGLLDVLKGYKVGMILEPGTYNDSNVYKNIQEVIKEKNIKHYFAKSGMSFDLGNGAYLEILFPDRDVSFFENNDGSVISRLIYGNTKIMLTGDATIKTEKIILENNNINSLESNFLKLGHHGSRTSSSLDFIKKVNPKYALISSGKENKYGHPHKEVLNILNSLGIKIIRTDQNGTFILKSDGQNEEFSFIK